jgi:hypothetical protein
MRSAGKEVTMAHYFFNLRHKSGWLPDPRGADVRGLEAILSHASSTALELITERPNALDWSTCRFEIADECGRNVYVLPFSRVICTAQRRVVDA